MEQIIFRPKLYQFEDPGSFAEAFHLGKEDLILTNRYIFDPYFGGNPYGAQLLFQEEFGAGEPTDVMVDAIIRAVSGKQYHRIIAIGGGTVIDIAKVLSVSGGKPVDELYAHKDELKKAHPLVIIPTTCGTGSEMTDIAIINRTRLGVKMGLTGEALYADAAVLIPQFLKKIPLKVFATSSIDALVHAVESSLSPKATAFTKLFGYKAIEMIIGGYRKLAENGMEGLPDLMENFLVASNMAGLAFGTAGCAAVHALSYPLGGTYHVAHGESNYALFTGVLNKYMEKKSDGEIAHLNRYLAGLLDCEMQTVYAELESLLNRILPKRALREYGMTEQDIDIFTENVFATQGRLMANNFVELDRKDVENIYRKLL